MNLKNSRPPLPQWSATRTLNVEQSLYSWITRVQQTIYPYETFILGTVTLLALTYPSRLVDQSKLDLNRRQFTPEDVLFLPGALR